MDKISTSEKGRIPGKEGVMGEVIKGRARIVWNHCAGFDSGILLCSVDTKQASADPPESGTGNCAGVGI